MHPRESNENGFTDIVRHRIETKKKPSKREEKKN